MMVPSCFPPRSRRSAHRLGHVLQCALPPLATVRRIVLPVLLAWTALALPQRAQGQSGALFLLVPFGARAVGQGQAVSADTALGVEALWWNPAGLARLAKRDVALHHSQTVLANSDMVSLAFPSKVLGTLAVGAYLVNYGDQQATDPYSGQPTGVITNRNYLLTASYATPVGKRLNVGVTYKFLMLRFACSGACGSTPVISGQSSALDVGAQYLLPTPIPVSIGASVRNVGPALQVKDRPQADPLPTVVQVGVRSRVPLAALESAGATLDASLDLVSASALGGLTTGIGTALGYKDQVFLRAGYVQQAGEGSGPTIGFGVQRGAFGFDIARRFDRLSAQLGQPPTYIMLRAAF